MGKYVTNNIVNLGAYGSKIDHDDAVREIAVLLGVGKGSDGQYHLADICQAVSINMWAKYKPVRHSTSANLTDAQRQSVDYGLDYSNAKISSTTDVSNIASKYTADGKNGWSYNKPRGSSVSPTEYNRLRDFHGYNHGALPFVYDFTIPSAWAKDQGAFDVSFRIPVESDEHLTYKDLPSLQNYYLGVALINGSNVLRMTNSKPISEDGLALQVPVTSIDAATYTIYPLLSSVPLSILDGGFVAASVYTIPQSSAKTLVLSAGTVTITIQGYFTNEPDANGYYDLTYTINIKNNSAGEIVLSNNFVYLLYGNRQSIGSLDKDEKMQELNLGNDIRVAAGKTEQVFGIIQDIIPALQANSRIWVSLQSSKYVQNAPPMQNMNPDLTEA